MENLAPAWAEDGASTWKWAAAAGCTVTEANPVRSEERRVGKECRSRCAANDASREGKVRVPVSLARETSVKVWTPASSLVNGCGMGIIGVTGVQTCALAI